MSFALAVERLKAWDDVYQAQVALLNDPSIGDQMGMDSYQHVSNHRTLHMGAGRQNGSTVWVTKKLVDNPDNIVIVRDVLTKQSFYAHPLVQARRADAQLREQVFTEYDLRSMLRTKSEKLDRILRDAERVFFDEASFVPMYKLLKLIADYLKKDVVVVGVH